MKMWNFLSEVLKQGGLVALLFTVLAIGFVLTIRVLWKQNQDLHVKLQSKDDQRASEITALVQRHSEQIREQQEECAEQLQRMASRIDDLQERRVTEAQEVTEKVVTYIGHIDQAVDKMESAIDVLIQAGKS